MRRKIRDILKAMHIERREHKSSFIVYVVLRLLVLVAMVLQVFNKNYENVFLCVLTLVLLMLPSFIQVNMKIELPTGLEIVIMVFVFAAEILGETHAYYIKYPQWDMALHTVNGFLMAAIGFSLVDILNKNQNVKFNLSPAFMAVVAFCFSMTIGVVWEFFEYGMDIFFGYDMQKDTIVNVIHSVALDPTKTNTVMAIENIQEVLINGKELGLGGYLDIGLHDTMKDLLVNFVGAVVFSVIGFFYVKNRGKGGFASRFIPRLKDKDRDYLKQVQEESKEKERLKSESQEE